MTNTNKSSEISACIIVKNEESMIRDCLNSINDVVDEIIIADTGSTDNTIEICKEFTDKVYKIKWENDFSKARNFTLEKASKNLILVIDADERLINPKKLLDLKNQDEEDAGGYLIKLSSPTSNNEQSYVNQLLRIIRNDPEIRFSGIIHEQIIESIKSKNLKIKTTDVEFEHLGYGLSAEEMNKKHLRNLHLLEKAIAVNPNDYYNVFQHGKTLLALGENQKAKSSFNIAIDNLPSAGAVYPQALNFAAINHYRLGELQESKNLASKSIKALETQAFPHFIMGEIMLKESDYKKSLYHYEKALELSNNNDLKSQIVGDISVNINQINNKISQIKGIMNSYYTAPNSVNALKSIFQESSKESKENRKLLSLSMIVKNEEDSLAACLESVKNLVDEIVIVDTGSTDRTVEIAESFGAKVHYFEWVNDFAKARNESLKYCSGEWILYLDADERVEIDSIEKFRIGLEHSPSDLGGLICTIESKHQLNDSSEIHRGGYPRLFRNIGYPKLKFIGRVHEQISPSIRDAGLGFDHTNLKIIHIGYDISEDELRKKLDRNYKLLMQHVNEEPTNGYAWYQLGQTLGQMKLNKEAEEAIRFSVKCGNLSDSVLASAANSLAHFSGNKRNFKEALTWAEKSLDIAPEQVYGLNLKAYALLNLGRKVEARKEFEKALKVLKNNKNTPKSGFDVIISEEKIRAGLKSASS